jgi:hypothetical protein
VSADGDPRDISRAVAAADALALATGTADGLAAVTPQLVASLSARD